MTMNRNYVNIISAADLYPRAATSKANFAISEGLIPTTINAPTPAGFKTSHTSPHG